MNPLFSQLTSSFIERSAEHLLSLEDYLELCKNDPSAYDSAPQRMLKAIGDPKIIDTRTDARMSRIFSNRVIRVYPAFQDFYGMEDTIENIVSYFRHSAQGLEESKQILYLLGPVGGGKSSLAEKLKELMENVPVYVLDGSPVFESPLGLFSDPESKRVISDNYKIPLHAFKTFASPWALEKLKEFKGDLSKFKVRRIYPSRLRQECITRVEPGDENNQDISALVGEMDIRMIDKLAQNHPYAYSFSGGLNRGNNGLVEMVEMFKAPIKMLHPLLTATQDRSYTGTKPIGSIPFNGVVLAHCFSEDTELLTETGWKTHHQITPETKLATFNKVTGQTDFQRPLKKFEEFYSGPMQHFLSNSCDHLVTPNHKMIFHTQYTKQWKDCYAKDYGDTGKIIPVAAPVARSDYPISDSWLRLAVWTIADGSLSGNKVRFHLGKPRKIQRLTRLLEEMNAEFTETETSYVTSGGLSTVSIRVTNNFEVQLSKDFPSFWTQLSARQCRIVIEEYSYTDGSRQESGSHYQLSSNKKEHIDILQQLSFLAGCKANFCLAEYPEGNHSPQYFLSVRPGVTETRTDYAMRTVPYSGVVFCYETPNHTLIARRNGKVIVTGNSNEQEWQQFRNNKTNEAFLDRVYMVKVPYVTRLNEEAEIYKKLLSNSELRAAPCAPGTLEILSQFCVMSRLKVPQNSTLFLKMRVYNGENVKNQDPRSRPIQEYKDIAGVNEGMDGLSTRFAFKILSKTFNYDTEEIAANPIHLMYILKNSISEEQFPKDKETELLGTLDGVLMDKYLEYLEKDIRASFLDSFQDLCQNLFENYFYYADAWVSDSEYRDVNTGTMLDRNGLNAELEKIEKPAGIDNPKDFRNDITMFVIRYRGANKGKLPRWNEYEKMRIVIEKKVLATTDEILPVISFAPKRSDEETKKHNHFVAKMKERGYTERQTRFLCEFFMRARKSS